MKKQVKKIFYSFTINRQTPLDDRIILSSLDNLATELPLNTRYLGQIFWVTDIEDFYCFEADLNNPVNFRQSAIARNIQGITVTDTENGYADLLADLNELQNVPLGQVVAVFPLGVAFKWNGTSWSYAFGIFNVPDTNSFAQIDASLLATNARVSVNGTLYIVTSALGLSTQLITVQPTGTPENERYYLLNGTLFIGLAGTLYKLGTKSFVAANTTLNIGNSQITHNLNSPYVRGIIWIESINKLCDLSLTYMDANNSIVNSRVEATGTLVILADN
jgi:hypothetical protein